MYVNPTYSTVIPMAMYRPVFAAPRRSPLPPLTKVTINSQLFTLIPLSVKGELRHFISLKEVLGKGNFGKVKKVEEVTLAPDGSGFQHTGRYFALKSSVIKPPSVARDHQLVKLRNETVLSERVSRATSHAVGSLAHDKFLGKKHGVPTEKFYNLQPLESHTLMGVKGLIEAARIAGRINRLEHKELILMLAKDIINAVAACHQQGVLHRDISEDNILVSQDFVAKLADFNLSNDVNDRHALALGAGKPLHMSLEEHQRFRSHAPLATGSDDVYALGMTLHKLLFSCLPYTAYKGMSNNSIEMQKRNMVYQDHMERKFLDFPQVRKVIAMMVHPQAQGRPTMATVHQVFQSLSLISDRGLLIDKVLGTAYSVQETPPLPSRPKEAIYFHSSPPRTFYGFQKSMVSKPIFLA